MSRTGQEKGPLKRFRKKEIQDWRLKDSTSVKLTLVEKMNVEMARAQNILKDTNKNRFLLTTAPQFFRLMETFSFFQ